MRGLPIVISAPSGAGKGTVIPFVMKGLKDAAFSVSCTTRSPRPGEVHGVNYFFISRDEFLKRLERNEMLEHNEYVGNMYGTPRKETEDALSAGKDVIFEIDVNGAMNIKNAIVLVDQIGIEEEKGTPRLEAIIEATKSRIVPVAMASGTTILGMLPLLFDAMFGGMAACIMGGLLVASLLTIFVLPVTYSLLFRVKVTDTPEVRMNEE